MSLKNIDFAHFKEEAYLEETSPILNYPEICLSCGKRFSSSEEFVKETALLPSETYFDSEKNEVVDHRQCECGETLTARRADQRGKTPKDKVQRTEFQNQLMFLVKNGISMERARNILSQKRRS